MVDIITEQAGARDVEAGGCGHRGQGQGLCNWQTGRFLEIQEYRAVQQKKTRKKIQEKCKYQVNGRANIQSFRLNRRYSSSKTGPFCLQNCQAPSRWESREQVVLVKPVTTRCLRLIDHDAKVIFNIIDISVLNKIQFQD